jgi:hypothetical protein
MNNEVEDTASGDAAAESRIDREPELPELSEREVYEAMKSSEDEGEEDQAAQDGTSCPKQHQEKAKKKHGTEKHPRYCNTCGQQFPWVLQCPACEQQWCMKCHTKGPRRASKRSKKRQKPSKPKCERKA